MNGWDSHELREKLGPIRPAQIAADWVLTGASRVITCAPDVLRGLRTAVGHHCRRRIAAQAGRIVWVGPDDELAQAVDLSRMPQNTTRRGWMRCTARLCTTRIPISSSLATAPRSFSYAIRCLVRRIAERGGGILDTVRATRAADTESCAHWVVAACRASPLMVPPPSKARPAMGWIYVLKRVVSASCRTWQRAGIASGCPDFSGSTHHPAEYRGNPGRTRTLSGQYL